MNNAQKKNYFDTCTVIDAIDDHSQHHINVNAALGQIKGNSVFSEYMEDELKRVLRKSERFRSRMDNLLKNYGILRQQLSPTFVENDTRTGNLERHSKRISKKVGIKQADVVHVGICGEENIENVVSEDRHLNGRSQSGRPFIDEVKDKFSQVYNRFSDPKHAFSTRGGFPKQCV